MITLSGCENNKEEGLDPICHLIDWGPPSFRLTIQDTEGNNLIENGTYNKEIVDVFYDGNLVGGAGKNYSNPQNNVLFSVAGNGDKDYLVFLNEFEIDTIQIPAIQQEFCGIAFFAAESVTYNGKKVDSSGDDLYSIVIIK